MNQLNPTRDCLNQINNKNMTYFTPCQNILTDRRYAVTRHSNCGERIRERRCNHKDTNTLKIRHNIRYSSSLCLRAFVVKDSFFGLSRGLLHSRSVVLGKGFQLP
jgi:hypothetical protein